MFRINQLLQLFIVFLVSIQGLQAQQVFPSGGSGSYRLDYPANGYAHHIYAPIGDNRTGNTRRGPGYTGPFQTHQWWNSALWTYTNQRHSDPMYPYPLFLQAVTDGYILRYGTQDINGLNSEIECHSAVTDARVGLNGLTATQTSVDSYGDWHAVLYQDYGGGNSLRMTAAKGCPFAFFRRTGNVNPIINGLNKEIVRKSTSGNSFIFRVAPEGRDVYFAVFFPAGTQMGTAAPTTNINAVPLGNYGSGWDNMVFGLPGGSNYFSVAVMSNNASQAVLDMYEARAFNFITGTTHSYVFDEANSRLTTTFAATTTAVYGGGNGGLGTLQALMKHQYLYSPQAATAANTGVTYYCPRGTMQLLATNTFTTVMTHNGILPNLAWANYYSVPQMRAYIDNYLPTVAIPQDPADGYNKDGLVDLANIAQIASQIGYTAAKNRCLDAMQQRLTNWFTSPTTENWAIFVYSNQFNWLAHYPNGFTSSGEFIDMHFHMAYLVYGAAILARYRPAWAAQYGPMVETMIRQINDHRKDVTAPAGNIGHFPYLRCFDPYEGHSWADPSAGNQESVSESLTFALGTFLWGETVGNDQMRDLGALLYITEAETAKLYWFDVDENINRNWGIGTTSYTQHHMTILRASGGSYATFFSADDRWKHSIDLLPQTAGSLWQIWDPAEAQTMFNHLPAGGYTAWDDHGYNYNFLQAGFNAGAALTAFNSYATSEQWINPTFPHVNGDIPILYQWINTLNTVGTFDNTVQANITGFSVFKKGTCKHYMIYNPPNSGTRLVTFTDGNSFNVPDDTVIVYQVCPSPVTWLSFEGERIGSEQVRLNWATALEKDNDYFDIERSTDGINWMTVGRKKGNGNSTTVQSYEHLDAYSVQGTVYYRLRQVDFNGQYEYSKIISILATGLANSAFIVYPNPTQGIVTVSQSLGNLSDYDFALKNLLGQPCSLTGMASEEQQKVFDLSSLSKGIYLLEIFHRVTGETTTVKLISE